MIFLMGLQTTAGPWPTSLRLLRFLECQELSDYFSRIVMFFLTAFFLLQANSS